MRELQSMSDVLGLTRMEKRVLSDIIHDAMTR
jgi:hypothetical protein